MTEAPPVASTEPAVATTGPLLSANVPTTSATSSTTAPKPVLAPYYEVLKAGQATVPQTTTSTAKALSTQPTVSNSVWKPTTLTSRESNKDEAAESQEKNPQADDENKVSEPGTGLAKAYAHAGKEAFKKGNITEAIAQYTEALRLDPDLPEVHTELGLLLIQEGKLKEAAAHLSEALKLNPKDKTARENLDLVLTKLGRTSL